MAAPSGEVELQPVQVELMSLKVDLNVHQRARAAIAARRGPFLHEILCLLFGDGDPNVDYERRRWEALAFYLERSGGVVVAEEMAPFLDVTVKQVAEAEKVTPGRVDVDESYVMPALARFGGSPEVDPDGRIFYRFLPLQQAASGRFGWKVPPAALEQPWAQLSSGEWENVLVLGAFGTVGVFCLGHLLGNPRILAMPLVQVCVALFFALPAVRCALNAWRNQAVQARNAGRLEAYNALCHPSAELKAKLDAAAERAKLTVIREGDVVHSEREVEAQPVERWEALVERRAAEQETTCMSFVWFPDGYDP